ncbi:hypothetical protein PVAP13_6NG099300 [Panicum virgatum]|uniref:Uncharacterized protein n=1 Tax=Panicum virgatum TaxID=38727 RepID=A0A8T0QWR9_PANVG|nr:hypothetical protein PVAP13_6NG099300 [Panicum virgatum]
MIGKHTHIREVSLNQSSALCCHYRDNRSSGIWHYTHPSALRGSAPPTMPRSSCANIILRRKYASASGFGYVYIEHQKQTRRTPHGGTTTPT